MKNIGKPDAGKLHVRFDEGGQGETCSLLYPIICNHLLALRIFKRNFTTKEQLGHGLGTYSMKFFGEKVLGGLVDFTTSETAGTTFRLTLMH